MPTGPSASRIDDQNIIVVRNVVGIGDWSSYDSERCCFRSSRHLCRNRMGARYSCHSGIQVRIEFFWRAVFKFSLASKFAEMVLRNYDPSYRYDFRGTKVPPRTWKQSPTPVIRKGYLPRSPDSLRNQNPITDPNRQNERPSTPVPGEDGFMNQLCCGC